MGSKSSRPINPESKKTKNKSVSKYQTKSKMILEKGNDNYVNRHVDKYLMRNIIKEEINKQRYDLEPLLTSDERDHTIQISGAD
jgi:hypothetical protein